LEGGTSLENYMRESDLASPLKERKDDAMQFVSAAQLTKSVVYEDDYDMEDFDLLSVRANEVVYSFPSVVNYLILRPNA
jgi:hypothetical protein